MDKYEVVTKGANNAKNEPYKVGSVIELDKVPSFLVGKVRKVSDLADTGENEEVKSLKAENEALKAVAEKAAIESEAKDKEFLESLQKAEDEKADLLAEIESLKKAPELSLEPATPKTAAKK